MKEVVLLVTWFLGGQPPTSYTATFATMQACEAARAQLVAEEARFARQQEADNAALAAGGARFVGVYPRGPQLSAVCAAR